MPALRFFVVVKCRQPGFLAAAFWLAIMAGCSQRCSPPELEYSDADVQLIRRELESVDWS